MEGVDDGIGFGHGGGSVCCHCGNGEQMRGLRFHVALEYVGMWAFPFSKGRDFGKMMLHAKRGSGFYVNLASSLLDRKHIVCEYEYGKQRV